MNDPLEEQIGTLLVQRRLKLVAAESCTGGLIGHRITNVPGSSYYFLGSVTAYHFETKERLLGVRHDTLTQYGEVSRETALEMAAGARAALAGFFIIEHLVGLSVTGIAGPGGAGQGKPVGLVWIGLSAADGNWAWRYHWQGNRLENKERSAEQALRLLRDYLRGSLPPETQEGI